MCGHVDDFNRAGDMQNPKWLAIRESINKAYKWGTSKTGSYRHVGADIIEKSNGIDGRYIEISQDFYVETLADLDIDPARFHQKDIPLNHHEITLCRAALGAISWLAIQTQPLLCARTNLLLSDLAREPGMSVAHEVQQLINEARRAPTKLQFKKIPSVKHWRDMVVITLGDQAHNNRPDGGSTGGLATFLGGPEHLSGQPGPLSLISWKTWKLKRVAISSNDGEIQAMVESEDVNFRTRLLWSEMNGGGVDRPPGELLDQAEAQVRLVKGIVGTDSKGGFDAVTLQEGPYLGLSNARSAVQAFQIKQSFENVGTRLIWLSGDWMLADALTKRHPECRRGLQQFLQQWIWMLSYDPNFITSARKSKQKGSDATTVMKLRPSNKFVQMMQF